MKVYNTLSRQKEEFAPLGDEVKMYVCGITPYAPCHLGHAMSYIVFDTIRRYLEFRGYRVKYVQNFTDVDDKIIAKANELGIPIEELSQGLIEEYFAEMDALNVKRANFYPKATEEIPDIIEAIGRLLEKGYAYEAKGDVYFRIKTRPDYGKLSHRNLEGMMAGARVEVEEAKEHPLDFALWKAAKPGEPSWECPWGAGRPGWHIECSVMAQKYLGESIDIHGGGQDLIFPHHENEIAQSESLTGVPFARYWLHNGLLQLGQNKMSKSLGNLITVEEALSKYSPDAIRLFVLSSHYRSPMTYFEYVLEAMEGVANRLRLATIPWSSERSSGIPIDPEPFEQRFIEAMDDDFNTAQAIAVLFDLAGVIERGRDEALWTLPARHTLIEFAYVLGLTLKPKLAGGLEELREIEKTREEMRKISKEAGGGVIKSIKEIEEIEGFDAMPFIKLLVSVRDKLRAEQNWALADDIRNRLRGLGIVFEDTAKGTVWRYHKEKPS